MLSVYLIIWTRRKVTFSSKIDTICVIIKTPLFDRMHKPNDYANIYSPKESPLKNSTRGPFGFECLSFTFFLSPEGSFESRARMGSNWFFLHFNYSELLSRKVFWCVKNILLYRPFWNLEIALLWWVGGWMDGWVGCDILPPSIFFIFKYDIKQH